MKADYAQSEEAVLEVDLAGTTAGDSYDQLAVSGEVSLAGLIEIAVDEVYSPVLEDAFTVLTFGSREGNFDRYDGLLLDDGLALRPVFEADRLDLVTKLAGDLNDDGFVGSQDLDTIRARWGQEVSAGDWASGDISGDGRVGSADLDVVRAHWGGSAESAAIVPEPSVLALLLSVFGAAIFTRRTR